MLSLSPDLTSNLIHTIYLLFAHNYIVFAYFLGLLISIILSIKHPSKFTVFLLLGFALLTFSFEYDKHIAEGLRNQTVNSLITERPHYTVQKWLNLVITDLLPIFFYSIGWCFIYAATILGVRKPKSN
jgi:hypothetical protein